MAVTKGIAAARLSRASVHTYYGRRLQHAVGGLHGGKQSAAVSAGLDKVLRGLERKNTYIFPSRLTSQDPESFARLWRNFHYYQSKAGEVLVLSCMILTISAGLFIIPFWHSSLSSRSVLSRY